AYYASFEAPGSSEQAPVRAEG
ncbi:hypothetical protein AHiyo6_27950, partial [Arthrobacter sp. Hiyo6]